MNKPLFIINSEDLSSQGALKGEARGKVQKFLLNRGLLLLPSDTCYAVTMCIYAEKTREIINKLLDRRDEPLSIVFDNLNHVSEYIVMNTAVSVLIEKFTPGPITIVSKANDTFSEEFTKKFIGSDNHTIGFRIPDSIIERQVSLSTQYPTPTVAVVDQKDNKGVRDFDIAYSIIQKAIDTKFEGKLNWGAIEGKYFPYNDKSTVVMVESATSFHVIRRGADIKEEDIIAAKRQISQWSIVDWT